MSFNNTDIGQLPDDFAIPSHKQYKDEFSLDNVKPYATYSSYNIKKMPGEQLIAMCRVGIILHIVSKPVSDQLVTRQHNVLYHIKNPNIERSPSNTDLYVVNTLNNLVWQNSDNIYLHINSITCDKTIEFVINVSRCIITCNDSFQYSHDILNINLYNFYDSKICIFMLPQYKTIYDYIEQYIQMIKTVFIERGLCEDLYLQIIYFIGLKKII